jgi:hypothetical protein
MQHTSYGTLGGDAGLMPVWESAGVFAAKALGPIVRSNGYPSPATLPASVGGGTMGYSSAASGSVWSWKLVLILLVIGAIGVYIVHHATWA